MFAYSFSASKNKFLVDTLPEPLFTNSCIVKVSCSPFCSIVKVSSLKTLWKFSLVLKSNNSPTFVSWFCAWVCDNWFLVPEVFEKKPLSNFSALKVPNWFEATKFFSSSL